MVNQDVMVNLIISDIWNRLYNLIWVESYYPLVNPLYEQLYLFKHGWMWRHLLARGLQVLPSCLLCYCVKSQYWLYMFKNIWNASLNKINPLFNIYNWTYFSCAIIKIVYKIIWLDMRFILFTIFFGTIVKDVLDISWFKTIFGSDEMTPLVGPWEISLFLSILIIGQWTSLLQLFWGNI